MIILIFLISIGALLLGLWLAEHFCHEWFCIISVFGGAGILVAVLAGIVLTIEVAGSIKIDEKISLYEAENARIEEAVADAVEKYMEHEQGIFEECTPESAMTLVAVYPELKSDRLIEHQIEVYLENNRRILELREDLITAPVKRWWLYFGR